VTGRRHSNAWESSMTQPRQQLLDRFVKWSMHVCALHKFHALATAHILPPSRSVDDPAMFWRACRQEQKWEVPVNSPRRSLHPGQTSRSYAWTCGQDTCLRRRSAHSADGDAYELQAFACRACKASTTRTVDSEGRLFG
jgi:hypothetical protein